jgi:DNA-binding transcriptional LysR family regulator
MATHLASASPHDREQRQIPERGGDMNLEQLRLFACVAEYGSLTKAAVALDSQQSVVSRQLSSLEAEFGGRLFYRTGRGVSLTELGTTLLPRAQRLLRDIEDLAEDMKAHADVPGGDVRFGILPAFSYPLVNQLYRQTRERYPRVKLHLFEGSNGQLQEWVASGRVDIALLYRYESIDSASERVLGKTDAYLVGSAGDRVTSQPTITFRELENLPLVVPSTPNALRSSLDQLARRAGISLTIAMEADSLPIQKSIVADGGLYTIIGRQAVTREIDTGLLQASRIVDPAIERTAILLATTQRSYTIATRAVTGLIEPLAINLLARYPANS